MMKMTLPVRPPFSLSAIVRSHGWVSLVPFGTDARTGGLTRAERLASGRVIEMLIQEVNSGVSVEVSDRLSEAEREEVVRKVEWMLGLGQDFSAFYTLAREEPRLVHVEARAQGRILRCPTLFEDVVKTILTTNTRWTGTIRMVEALVSQFGTPLPADLARHAFPTPAQLAATDVETLRSVARLGYRTPYILELAQSVASGALDLEALKTADIPTPQLRKQLRAIKGVGDYAVACLLILLGRYDAVPVDSWALTLVSREWYGGAPVERAQVEAAFERWGEWQGLAYWFWDWSHTNQTSEV